MTSSLDRIVSNEDCVLAKGRQLLPMVFSACSGLRKPLTHSSTSPAPHTIFVTQLLMALATQLLILNII